jgi:hypothetical protein
MLSIPETTTMLKTQPLRTHLTPNVVYTLVPGPTRKRVPCPYRYRLVYRNCAPNEPGCVLLWEVDGGRMNYQIALERQETGRLAYHCTCADAIYRGADRPHQCKHVKALLTQGRRSAPRTI